jgi:hypothetical protein
VIIRESIIEVQRLRDKGSGHVVERRGGIGQRQLARGGTDAQAIHKSPRRRTTNCFSQPQRTRRETEKAEFHRGMDTEPDKHFLSPHVDYGNQVNPP